MTKLNNSGMRDFLSESVLELDVPILGVCVGMQMISYGSDEEIFLAWVGSQGKSVNLIFQSKMKNCHYRIWDGILSRFSNNHPYLRVLTLMTSDFISFTHIILNRKRMLRLTQRRSMGSNFLRWWQKVMCSVFNVIQKKAMEQVNGF